jgi:hypothetical protein
MCCGFTRQSQYNCGAKNIWKETIKKSQLLGGLNCLLRVVAFAKEKLQEMTIA